MLAYLKGKIKLKSSYLIIDVNGVGYKVAVTINILNKYKLGEEIELFLHEHLREDADDLYGFAAIDELHFFQDLISVSGIGPKSAMNIISRFDIKDIKKSIAHGDTSLLTKVSGVGKKTAERLILELKNKVDHLDKTGHYLAKNQVDEDAIAALVSLGYHKSQAIIALAKVDKDASLEDKIRQALKII